MAFVKISPKARHTQSNASTQITIGAYLGEGKGKEGAGVKHFTFRIPMSIMKESGIPFADRKLHLNIHEGTGEDAGFLMIVHDPVTGYTATQSKTKVDESHTGFSVNVALNKFSYYTPNEVPISATPVDHACQDGGILIECPEWLRPDIAKMTTDGLMPQPVEPPPPFPPRPEKAVDLAHKLHDAIPPNQRDKKNAASAAVNALDVVDQAPHEFTLNRSERRVLAAKVARTIGKRT